MPIKTTSFDASEFLGRPEAQAEFLAEAFESGSAAYIAHAFGVIARAKGMSQIARDSGLSREALYKSLSEEGDPRLSTILRVTKALGVKLSAAPIEKTKKRAKKAA